jgi:hypothetical protein
MGKRMDSGSDNALERQGRQEIHSCFGHILANFAVRGHEIDMLCLRLASFASAANLAVKKTQTAANEICDENGEQWFRNVELMPDFFLCHRPLIASAEFAVIECTSDAGTNIIWYRHENALEVLQSFVRELRQTFLNDAEEVNANIKLFLAQKFPNQNLDYIAEAASDQITNSALQNSTDQNISPPNKHHHI